MELIPVSKDGDYIEIHPATLADHKRMGWRECERKATQADINGDGKVTAAELRAALTAAGVPFKSNASKAELQSIKNAFERSGLSGDEWNNLADEDRANRVSY